MKLEITHRVESPISFVDLLHEQTKLSKSAIKKALNFGGGWLQKNSTGKKQRCRRATRMLQKGDTIEFHFDDQLYGQTDASAEMVEQTANWGVWYKPSNVVAQGTPFGDLGCMEDQVTKLSKQASVHLLHRLDREASGLMLFAYNKTAAAKLSEQWNSEHTEKFYQAEVLGTPAELQGDIRFPLDGKDCCTHYQVIETRASSSLVNIKIRSGRFHQIRRHFEKLGHPLMGDPRYGTNNKSDKGLQLVAYRLRFNCPISKQTVDCRVPDKYCLVPTESS